MSDSTVLVKRGRSSLGTDEVDRQIGSDTAILKRDSRLATARAFGDRLSSGRGEALGCKFSRCVLHVVGLLYSSS